MRILYIIVLSLVLGTSAHGGVYVNELTVRPVTASESVELYNSGPGAEDVGGWRIQGNKGFFIIPGPTVIPAGAHFFFASVGDISDERGGVTSLIDLVPGLEVAVPTVQDEVSYGQQGSAPLPPAGMSLARAPDASAGAPPAPDPDLDGLVWTIDTTPTFGVANNVPQPHMGGSVRINELNPGAPGGRDPLELYNPTGAPVVLNNWYLINGATIQFLNGVIPPGGFLSILTDPGFDLEDVGLIYLFQADEVRVDQLAFHDAPPLGEGQCYGRCPDGAPPYLGYTYLTSGGGVTFRLLNCTLGGSNGSACGSTPAEEKSWGSVKRVFR